MEMNAAMEMNVKEAPILNSEELQGVSGVWKKPQVDIRRVALMLGIGLALTVIPAFIWALFANGNGANDLLQPLRERQRVIELGRVYTLENSITVQVIRADAQGFVAIVDSDFNTEPKGRVLQFDKNGVAVTPNNPEFNMIRPLLYTVKK